VTPWRSPIPRGKGIKARVYAPGSKPELIATYICERGWTGRGVRVFRWPCGTLAVVPIGTPSDASLLSICLDALFATYARRTVMGGGPLYLDVLDDVRCAA